MVQEIRIIKQGLTFLYLYFQTCSNNEKNSSYTIQIKQWLTLKFVHQTNTKTCS